MAAQIEKLVETHKGDNLRGWVVYMGGAESKPALEKAVADKNVKLAVTFLPEGPKQASLARYKVNPEAKNTVLLYNRQQVQGNFVNVDEKSFDQVAKKAAEMLGK
ncbi:MAG: hypothetical protein ACK47B_12095 [Armatimonadota bacterium]